MADILAPPRWRERVVVESLRDGKVAEKEMLREGRGMGSWELDGRSLLD